MQINICREASIRIPFSIWVIFRVSNGGLGTGADSGGAVRAADAGAAVSSSRKNRVVEFGSMHTSGASILVHTIIYFGLITIFLIAIGVHIYTDLQTLASICFKNRGNCMIRKPVPHALKNRGLDDVNLWRSTPQLPTWHYP
ncbi:hypothetical protein CK203_068839 [Vitis vinifera]|uniref:Uncharacterized protein n=1 Tax=Vitis vinifera TaxID=29760 RepID=A0A438EY53_VITVI|nr:hypothetical protein CK203_068839 [Vitis vinifera]